MDDSENFEDIDSTLEDTRLYLEYIEKITENNDRLFNQMGELSDAQALFADHHYQAAEEKLLNLAADENLEIKADVLFFLGCCTYSQNRPYKAEQYWKSIDRELNKKYYAQAQYHLGSLKESQVTLNAQDRLSQAIHHWNNIDIGMDLKTYRDAQFNLGLLAYRQGFFDEAEQHWWAIKDIDDFDSNADVSLKLGALNFEKAEIALQDNNEQEAAIYIQKSEEYWANIKKEEIALSIYAIVQMNLGILEYRRKQYKKAIAYWCGIARSMNEDVYLQAQINLGTLYLMEDDISGAEACWGGVGKGDTNKYYVDAQFNLGCLKIRQNDFVKAEAYWDEINFQEDESSKKSFKDIMSLFWTDRRCPLEYVQKYYEKTDNCQRIRTFQHEQMYRISLLNDEKNQTQLRRIFDKVQGIMSILHLENPYFKSFCNKFAHYTQYTNALKMVDTSPVSFRLSAVVSTNDLMEGQLIDDLLGLDIAKEQSDDNNYRTFSGSFSFDHAALNQFRLYEKANQPKNSGASIVFDKSFFQINNGDSLNINRPSMGLTDIAKAELFQQAKTPVPVVKSMHPFGAQKNEVMQKIDKQPLYRCIYADPDSDYLRIARRSKWSFYRSDSDRKLGSKDRYESYMQDVNDADDKVNALMKSLKDSVADLKKSCKDEPNEQQTEVFSLLKDVLLPLRYLIKHVAFEAEEECRMIYITDKSDATIRSNYGNQWCYVEYEAPIKDHIDKIYLGQGAEDCRPLFEQSLGNKSKVLSSSSPLSGVR